MTEFAIATILLKLSAAVLALGIIFGALRIANALMPGTLDEMMDLIRQDAVAAAMLLGARWIALGILFGWTLS